MTSLRATGAAGASAAGDDAAGACAGGAPGADSRLHAASALATSRARQAVRRMGGDLLGDTSGSFRV